MTKIQPMLAAKLKADQTYDEMLPKLNLSATTTFYASPKLDGIRIFNHPRLGYVTRTLKPIPNMYLRHKLKQIQDYTLGFDGELILGDHTSSNYSFQDTTSAVMSSHGEPEDIKFHVFDACITDLAFEERFNYIVDTLHANSQFISEDYQDFVHIIRHEIIDSNLGYDLTLEKYLQDNYEGMMLRRADTLYKFGRSTWKQQQLIAIKPMEDAEAEVIGFECKYKNNNEATENLLGRTERSSSKEFKEPLDTLGYLKVRGINEPFKDIEFKIGTGFNDQNRKEIWDNQDRYLNSILTYKYQAFGVKDKPRTPVFKGFRKDI